ncbi:MAG: hypothetical protein Q8R22_03710 [Flavobacterium sp.]|uniref:hypothetical protein n=1 Tax=unclassified Flavobacterium TaxID=196869 RepID=UPI000C19C8C0|nr:MULTISPECIES: hypothetical protein [unclassified Flavobacterium]MDP3679925.1 hypothetical protein [Flavobacterium sp.]MDZ4329766.1 hypothetical protein [Flavobacterium sp.]PIF63572.1 hypothetical protein CLV00_3291 [Flavobacterium sp. 11]WKL44798.1 hypothetical protein Q1W72_04080 [Flavobacterium sp. ZE23DGlu08]
MELVKIEDLLEKYFQGETSIAEENELRNYFSSSNVAQHLEQYKPLFGYFSLAKEHQFTPEIPILPRPRDKKRNVAWISIAASVVVLLGIGTYAYYSADVVNKNQDLGTYDDPEEAFRATQKALSLLSDNVNVGIESVLYIQEYQTTKDKIFISTKKQSGGS